MKWVLLSALLLSLNASRLFGQPPAAPKSSVAVSASQTPSAAPLQTSPILLPASPTLPVSLNLRSWRGLPTADILVNGIFERFGLDTGLNANTITPAAMMRLQIPEGKTKVRVNILDRETEPTETAWKTLQIGLLKLENVPAAQLDVIALLSRTPHPDAPIAWLGTPFLAAFQVTFDLSHHVCTLEKPGAKLPGGAMVVPMTLRNGQIFVSVTLPKSKPFLALLDTSTVLTLIPAAVGEKLKLPALETAKLSGAGGKEVKAMLIQVPQIKVGQAEAQAMRVAYLSDDASPGFDRTTAVLGLDFLSRFKIVLNFAAKKVAFVPLTSPEPGSGG